MKSEDAVAAGEPGLIVPFNDDEQRALIKLKSVLSLEVDIDHNPQEAVKTIVKAVIGKWKPITFHEHRVPVGPVYRAALRAFGKNSSGVIVVQPLKALEEMAKNW